MAKLINSYIDHTLLKPDASKDNIRQLCEEAKLHQFASVCINPFWIEYAGRLLKNSEGEKKRACLLCVEAGAHFVKTSTGFSTRGATVHDIALMREGVGPTMGIKASGGIYEKSFALDLIAAGATRPETSKSLALVNS